jgi:hypothetical protein
MRYPGNIDARWIDALSDGELLDAEAELRERFAKQQSLERKRSGAAYSLLRGPEELTSAWMRWSMVSTATRERGLRARYRR